MAFGELRFILTSEFLLRHNDQYRHLQGLVNFHISTRHTHKNNVNLGGKNRKGSETKQNTVNMDNKNHLGGKIWGTKFIVIA